MYHTSDIQKGIEEGATNVMVEDSSTSSQGKVRYAYIYQIMHIYLQLVRVEIHGATKVRRVYLHMHPSGRGIARKGIETMTVSTAIRTLRRRDHDRSSVFPIQMNESTQGNCEPFILRGHLVIPYVYIHKTE